MAPMEKEYGSLVGREVWVLVDPPPGDNNGPGFEDPPLPPLPRPVPKLSDPVLARFRLLRDSYLANLLRRDGSIWPSGVEGCSGCRQLANADNPQLFRCKSCYGDMVLCSECIVARHGSNPLHRIERWNGRFFTPGTLNSLGLRVQLGHPPGERCPEATPLHSHFVVLHTNGLHEVAVDACDCEGRYWAGPLEEQLLRAGWFPATDNRPRTCATLEVLDNFLLQTYQAKRQCTTTTARGELAVRCPCCPHPGVNLPEDWEKAGPGDQFLYILFIAIDACFRLKRRLISSELKDPSLAPGWAYMLEAMRYRKYLLTVTDQKEMSTCSGLAALDYANTKFSRGYSATGVGMGVCARHEFVLANGVGDLQKGERYANMDYIFASIVLLLHPGLRKFISYDIVCQWWTNLKERLANLPIDVRCHLVLALCRFVIPKMHIKGHLQICQERFSLNLTPGSAQTDGEAIERPWCSGIKYARDGSRVEGGYIEWPLGILELAEVSRPSEAPES
ncbi:hypothetical protein B0H14DRAFT_2713442, partial [Mycena olivaceomarginata]